MTTYQLLPVLSQYGYTETAYRILLNEEAPGWLYAVKKGATTIWENWYGITEDGVPQDSHNHYSSGAVVSWLFAYCAGIQPLEAGFSKVKIAPQASRQITWANAHFLSQHGKISSEWSIEGTVFHLTISTPVPAEIHLPNGERKEVPAGNYQFSCEIG